MSTNFTFIHYISRNIPNPSFMSFSIKTPQFHCCIISGIRRLLSHASGHVSLVTLTIITPTQRVCDSRQSTCRLVLQASGLCESWILYLWQCRVWWFCLGSPSKSKYYSRPSQYRPSQYRPSQDRPLQYRPSQYRPLPRPPPPKTAPSNTAAHSSPK